MTTDPPVYEDWNGDLLHVFAQADDIRVTISERPDDDYDASVDIPFADVRKVTAAMHEKAGLPDRWALLREHLDGLHRTARDESEGTAVKDTPAEDRLKGLADGLWDVLRVMDDMEAGQ